MSEEKQDATVFGEIMMPEGTPTHAQHTYTAACDGFHGPGPCPGAVSEEKQDGAAVTVIIVVEAGGRERRYAADKWSLDADGELNILRSKREPDTCIARYNIGAWLSVREDGAVADDDAAARHGSSTIRAVLSASDDMTLRCFAYDGEVGQLVEVIDEGDAWETIAAHVAEHQGAHGCAKAAL